MFELKAGDERYKVYQVREKKTGVEHFRIDKHVYDLSNSDIFNKTLIDVTENFVSLQEAVSSIDRKVYYSGQIKLLNENLRKDINIYLSASN